MGPAVLEKSVRVRHSPDDDDDDAASISPHLPSQPHRRYIDTGCPSVLQQHQAPAVDSADIELHSADIALHSADIASLHLVKVDRLQGEGEGEGDGEGVGPAGRLSLHPGRCTASAPEDPSQLILACHMASRYVGPVSGYRGAGSDHDPLVGVNVLACEGSHGLRTPFRHAMGTHPCLHPSQEGPCRLCHTQAQGTFPVEAPGASDAGR